MIDVDAMLPSSTKTLSVEVTQECIDEGCRGNVFSCPVALALALAAGVDTCDVVVDGHSLAVWIDGVYWRADSPSSVNEFIVWFDNSLGGRGALEPFKFEAKFHNNQAAMT